MTVNAVSVGEVATLHRRWINPDPMTEYIQIGVRGFGRGIFHYPPTSGMNLGRLRFATVEPGDLVVSNIKAWEGAIAIAGDGDANCIASNRFLTYRVSDERADARYLRYFFLSEAGLRLIGRASPGSADRNRTLAIDRFEALEIPLPPIDEQRRIANHLQTTLAKTERVVARTNAVDAAAILSLFPALVDSVFSSHAAPASHLGEAVEVVTDSVRPGEDAAPAEVFVGLQHIETHTGRLLGFEPLGAEKAEKRRFAPGDIVYGTLRPNLNKVWVADRAGLCSVDQRVLRPRAGFTPILVAHGMRSRSFLTQVMQLVPGLQLPRIRLTKLLELQLPTVPEGEASTALAEMAESLECITRLVDLRRRRNALLEAVAPSVLNAAFSGTEGW